MFPADMLNDEDSPFEAIGKSSPASTVGRSPRPSGPHQTSGQHSLPNPNRGTSEFAREAVGRAVASSGAQHHPHSQAELTHLRNPPPPASHQFGPSAGVTGLAIDSQTYAPPHSSYQSGPYLDADARRSSAEGRQLSHANRRPNWTYGGLPAHSSGSFHQPYSLGEAQASERELGQRQYDNSAGFVTQRNVEWVQHKPSYDPYSTSTEAPSGFYSYEAPSFYSTYDHPTPASFPSRSLPPSAAARPAHVYADATRLQPSARYQYAPKSQAVSYAGAGQAPSSSAPRAGAVDATRDRTRAPPSISTASAQATSVEMKRQYPSEYQNHPSHRRDAPPASPAPWSGSPDSLELAALPSPPPPSEHSAPESDGDYKPEYPEPAFEVGQHRRRAPAPPRRKSVSQGYDEHRISPITGLPTKILSKRSFPPKDAARRRFHCEHPGCHKSFGRPSARETHLRTHNGIRPFTCPVPTCARNFSVFSNLKRHMIVHPSVEFRGMKVHDLPHLVWDANRTPPLFFGPGSVVLSPATKRDSQEEADLEEDDDEDQDAEYESEGDLGD